MCFTCMWFNITFIRIIKKVAWFYRKGPVIENQTFSLTINDNSVLHLNNSLKKLKDFKLFTWVMNLNWLLRFVLILQKLPLTIPLIVSSSPFRGPDNMLYTGMDWTFFDILISVEGWSDICSGDSCSCDDISDNKELEWGWWLGFSSG